MADGFPLLRNVKLVLEYEGTGLSGWQRQKNGLTVQEHLETALAQLFQQPITVTGASRTDAGVHARGQVANFTAPSDIPLHGIRRGLNSALPETIAVTSATEVPADFHARFSASGKRYRYDLLCRPDRSPLLRHRAWHRPRSLDVDAMMVAARALIGEHDFAAFRAAGCTAATTHRKVTSIDIRALGEVVRIDLTGNAFLRNMVRIITGTLVEVGEHRREIEDVAAVLAARDRTRAGQTAPAHGLTLMEVFYEPSRGH